MNPGGISMDGIVQPMANSLNQVESAMHSQISAMGNNPTTQDLLLLQQQMQKWSMFVQLQSSLVKEFGDAMKGIIQKAN